MVSITPGMQLMTTPNVLMETPAIAGAAPAKTTPFVRPARYTEDELNELKEALDQQTLFYAYGNKVKQLEQEFAAKHGFGYAVATSSGTASIHTAMIALGISPGDEVIVPPITDMGSLIPILYQGGIPVFADVDPYSYVLTPESVEKVISPRTRAVLAVHLWGNPCDLDGLAAICDKRGIIVIEDCAQAFGALYKGKPVGSFGRVGCFSYNEFKHVSCGDGGLVVTSDAAIARRLRLSTDKCYDRDPNALMRNPTFLAANYRMTELQGAVARAQLRKLDGIVDIRRNWCERLSAALSGVKGISLPTPTPGGSPSYWFYMLRAKPEELGVDTDKLAEALRAEGLPVGAHYIGRTIYEYPIFANHSAFERGSHPFAARQYKTGDCPTAEAVLETCVMLSIHEGYTDKDLEETVLAITRTANWFVNGASA